MIPGLRDFSFFLYSIFVYEPILIKISMNANIMKMQNFLNIKYDLKGHWRSQKVFFVFKNQLFLKYLFCLTFNLNQIMYKWLHNKDPFFLNMMFDLKGHIRINKTLFVYIFSSNNSMPLYLFSLSLVLLLSFSFINRPP